MTLQINDNGTIEELLRELPALKALFSKVLEKTDPLFTAEWYDLETCFTLRGGGKFSTLKAKRYYQPKGGLPDAIVQGRKVWSRETVKEWVKLQDSDLPEYHKKYKTGARL